MSAGPPRREPEGTADWMVSAGIWVAALFVDFLTARAVTSESVCSGTDRASLFRIAALCVVPFTSLGLLRVWLHASDTFAAIVRIPRLNVLMLAFVTTVLTCGLAAALLLVDNVDLAMCRP